MLKPKPSEKTTIFQFEVYLLLLLLLLLFLTLHFYHQMELLELSVE